MQETCKRMLEKIHLYVLIMILAIYIPGKISHHLLAANVSVACLFREIVLIQVVCLYTGTSMVRGRKLSQNPKEIKMAKHSYLPSTTTGLSMHY